MSEAQPEMAADAEWSGDLIDWSDHRELLDGSPLDRARWLLCSEGRLGDAAALDAYVVEARAAGAARYEAGIDAALHELGVPDEHYPAPVANAVAILRALLPAPPLRSPERDQAVIEQLDALGIGFDAPEQRDGLDVETETWASHQFVASDLPDRCAWSDGRWSACKAPAGAPCHARLRSPERDHAFVPYADDLCAHPGCGKLDFWHGPSGPVAAIPSLPQGDGLGWTAKQHREDAKLVQAAMQRIAERRVTHGTVYVPIEDASNLLMAMHRDGIYRPSRPAEERKP